MGQWKDMGNRNQPYDSTPICGLSIHEKILEVKIVSENQKVFFN